jgi:hypothetical protein
MKVEPDPFDLLPCFSTIFAPVLPARNTGADKETGPTLALSRRSLRKVGDPTSEYEWP